MRDTVARVIVRENDLTSRDLPVKTKSVRCGRLFGLLTDVHGATLTFHTVFNGCAIQESYLSGSLREPLDRERAVATESSPLWPVHLQP